MPAPTATDVRNVLEGYGINQTVLSDAWIEARRDRLVVPWVKKVTKLAFDGVSTNGMPEYYSGTGTDILFLRRKPIVELLAINYTNVPSNQFYISPLAIQVIQGEGILKARANFNEANYVPIFARGNKNLRITYSYGFADYPAEVSDAVAYLCAEVSLGFVGSRTGGGSLNVQGVGRNYGNRGKWTDIRNDLVRMAMANLRPYMTGATG